MRSLSPVVSGALGIAAGFWTGGASGSSDQGGHGGPVLLLGIACLGALLRGRSSWRPFAIGALVGLGAGARAKALDVEAPFVRAIPPAGARLDLVGTISRADPPGRGGVNFVLDVTRWTDANGPQIGSVRLDGLVPPPPPGGGDRDRDWATGPASGRPALLPGDRVHLAGIVDAIARPTNPGAFDARASAARHGIDARLLVPDGRAVTVIRHGDGPLTTLARGRARAARALDAAFRADDAGLLRSLCLGDRGGLSPDDRRRFREAGAAHILAISGSQVALLTAGLLWLLRRARVPPRPAAGIVLGATLLLVPFTGSAPPVVRSAAGFILFLGGRLLGREPTGTVLLAIVASGYAVLDPGAGSDAGFRMSFAAATGLILLAPRLRRFVVREPFRLPGTPPPKAWVRSALAAGTAAWLASTPFAVAAMGQAGWIAIPVGLVAVPLSTLILVAGAAAAAVEDMPILGTALVRAVEALIVALRWFLDLPKALGCATGPVEPPDALWYAAYLAAFVGLARGGARVAFASVIVLLALLVDLASRSEALPVDGVRLTLLDVGHGQAALLETSDGRRVLLDAGSRDRREPADRIVLPALYALRATTLDLAIVSHADSDHSGAIPRVLAEIPSTTLVIPPRFDPLVRARLAATGLPIVEALDGDGLLAGPWGCVRVLGPSLDGVVGASRNDDCLVLAIDTPWGSILLPGDRETKGVEALLAAHEELRATALVLPHHGHPDQGVDRLVTATRPSIWLASTPPSAVARLPAGTRATGSEGALVLTLDARGLVVTAPYDGRRTGAREYDRAASTLGATMRDPLSLATAAALLAVIGLLSIRLRWLTRGGAAGAVILGFFSTAAFGWSALAALLAPFLVATLAGKLPGGPTDEGPRTLTQVGANGLVSLVGAGLGLFHVSIGLAVFLGGLAALGADTLATEIGTRYGGTPRSLVSGKPLRSGESGGVTIAGLAASLVGACLAPLAFLLVARTSFDALLPLAAAGVAAGLADSALGAWLQRKGTCGVCAAVVESTVHCNEKPTPLARRLSWLDNDGVNLVNGLVGAALAVWWT